MPYTKVLAKITHDYGEKTAEH